MTRKLNKSSDWLRDWINQNKDLKSGAPDFISVTDIDLFVHKYRQSKDRLGERGIEHLIMLEIKVGTETMPFAQEDTLSAAATTFRALIPQQKTPTGVRLPRSVTYKDRKILWHGVHLVQIPPKFTKVGPVMWDRKHMITMTQLTKILRFELCSYSLEKLDLDRRHKPSNGTAALDLFAGA